jgi:hypothetical protein
MLSFVVTLIGDYERAHGVRPNVVYMSEDHYRYLREELPGIREHDDVTAILGLNIALTESALHPHVANVRFGDNHILSS